MVPSDPWHLGRSLTHQLKATSPSIDSSIDNSRPNLQQLQRMYASPQDSNSATGNMSVEEFRSIIDDLTVENRNLKEKLKQYETSIDQTPALANERLFEIKVHGLRTKKKQELIETLKAFASREDVRQEVAAVRNSEQSQDRRKSSSSRSAQPYATSASQSAVQDSAYASVSAPKSNPSSTDRKQSDGGARRRLSFVEETQPPDGTPIGLLPKITPFRTDREKKVMVVKRLEHLFNGESSKRGKGSYRSALNASGLSAVPLGDSNQAMEGMRESHIFDDTNDPHHEFNRDLSSTDESRVASPKLKRENSTDSDQRATRPLDVDPDRVQVPGDNINYIRHLGMSPRIAAEEKLPEASDHGWVYLNILINLAQLHILNVTPDFVRSAITEVSKKFELSPDRQKVRWRGAAQITKLASDSDVDRMKRDATTDSSDVADHFSGKKRKIINTSSRSGEVSIEQLRAHGQSADSNTWSGTGGVRRRTLNLEYKPVIIRPQRRSQFDDLLGEDFESSYPPRSILPGGLGSAPFTMASEGNSNTMTHRAEAGSIVFFGNASFYIDYSGDSSEVLAELQAQRGRYWDYRKRYAPLGSESSKQTPHTSKHSSSSSRMRSRPFKEYSKVGENFMHEDRSRTPDVLDSDCESSDLHLTLEKSIDNSSMTDSTQHPAPMEASGLSGIRPEDRFIITVETVHFKIDPEVRRRMEMQIKKAQNLDRRVAQLLRKIEEAKLGATRPVSQNATPRARPQQNAFVHSKVLSEKLETLIPSEIPPSAQFLFDIDSDSDGTSYAGSEDTNIRRLKVARPDHVSQDVQMSDDENGAWDEEDEDEDSEIDFLAEQRLVDPERVAMEERLYERVAGRSGEDVVMEDSTRAGTVGDDEEGGDEASDEDEDEEIDDDEEGDDDSNEQRAFEKFKRRE